MYCLSRHANKYCKNALNKRNIIDETLKEEITWHFIPPRAPHFGGLWESTVKSFKNHFKKVVGNTVLILTEFITLLVQIEAVLNSRPLTPISDDVNDFGALTPGHFLIGESLFLLPDVDTNASNVTNVARWKFIEKIKCDFWKRWKYEYLTSLQKRRKWNKKSVHEIEIGQLVVVKEDGTIPCQWILGRIEAVHAGRDNTVRVVDVRMKNNILRRPLTKICILPVN
jgi:Family of unknown function (DUF5641)